MGKRVCYVTNSYEIELTNGQKREYESWGKLRYTDKESYGWDAAEWMQFLGCFNFIEGYEGDKRWGKTFAKIKVEDAYSGVILEKIYKHKFKKAAFKKEYKDIDVKNYTMQDLIDRLPAEEFIEYLKDRGTPYINDFIKK